MFTQEKLYSGNNTGNETFYWDFGSDATPQTSTQQNPSGVMFSSSGDKSVMLTVTRFGCVASITKNVEIITVINDNNKKVIICHKGQTISVSQSALQAHLNHGDCVGQCFDSSSTKFMSQYDFNKNRPFVLDVLPNPFNENLYIKFQSFKNEQVLIEIYNYLGQKAGSIFNSNVKANQNNNLEFSTNSLNPGLYFLRVQTSTENILIKLIRTP